MNAPVMNFDAQSAMGFITSQRAHIEKQVNEEPRPDIQYPSLIPFDTTAHPFAKTVEYYSSTKQGGADWINGNSDDIPLAGTQRTKHQSAVYTAGIGYGFSWEEVGAAMMTRTNLSADDAMAARRASEEFIDGVALFGSASKGMGGLCNSSAVTAGSAPTGSWGGATEAQILADVNDILMDQETAVNYTRGSMADTLLLSVNKMQKLATTYRTNTDTTLLQLIQRSNAYTALTGQPLNIAAVRGLETAGAGSTERMVAYRRSPEVLKLHIPMPHKFGAVFQSGPLNFVVPGMLRLGGLDIRRPKEVLYRDGI